MSPKVAPNPSGVTTATGASPDLTAASAVRAVLRPDGRFVMTMTTVGQAPAEAAGPAVARAV